MLDKYGLPPRPQAYLSRDEAQAVIARILAEKDTLRSQLVELQETVFTLQAKRSCGAQQQSPDVLLLNTRRHRRDARRKTKLWLCVSLCPDHRRSRWAGRGCRPAVKKSRPHPDEGSAAWTPSTPAPPAPLPQR